MIGEAPDRTRQARRGRCRQVPGQGRYGFKHSPAYWDDQGADLSQHQLFQKYDHGERLALADHCHQGRNRISVDPFDDAAIELLDPLVPFFKIASADLTNIPFLRRWLSSKPVVLSTGAATLSEIDIALEALTVQAAGHRVVALHPQLSDR